jgi:hypothetical protein
MGCNKDAEQNPAFNLQLIPCASVHGGEPNLFVSDAGDAYLSWVEFLNDSTDVLLFSQLKNEEWTAPNEVVRGNDWFVNWADFPSLTVNGDWMAIHWLQKSAAGTYDYDIHITQSQDGGRNWQPSFIPHRDSVAAEHGFVTLLPRSKDRMFAVWLDGRNTKAAASSSDGNDHGHGGGAMTLRTAEFDPDGNLFAEAELDHRICDCCQTDAAMTTQGPVVVYRDRSEQEIRDIAIVRKRNGEWTEPALVHADNWKIAGCPVNGPAIATNGDNVAVVWFTAAEGEAAVNIVFSKDAGASFSAPVRIDDGTPSGRVDVAMLNEKDALVIWLEDEDQSASIRAVVVNEHGKTRESVTLVETTSARSSGFPILAKHKDHFLLAWTAVEGDSTRVKTGKFN